MIMRKKGLLAGQSGGPTAVINSSLYGVVAQARCHRDEIAGIYGMVNGIEGFLEGKVLDLKRTARGTLRRASDNPGRLLRLLPL